MSTIQTAVSALVLGLLLGLGLGGVGAWSWQSNKYDVKITKLQEAHNGYVREQQELVAQKAEEALKGERAATQRVQEAESKYSAANNRLTGVQAELDKLRRDYGGLYIKSSSCVPASANSPGTSGEHYAANPGAPTGLCKLSREFEESLIQTYRDADQMRNTLDLCRSYAEEINRFRSENGNTTKSTN